MDELPSPFRLAKLASKHSDFDKYKVGAVIVRRKRPISIGFNQLKSHPIYANCLTVFSIHAEMSAVIKSDENVDDADVYVYRENKFGRPALARPCNHCYENLKKLGVKRMFYTVTGYPYWKCERIL